MADRQRATGNIYMGRGGVGGCSCGSGFARYSGAAGGGAGGGGYLRSEMGRGRPAKGNHARNGGSQSQQLAATGRGGLLSSSASLRWLRSENAHFSTSHFLLNYFCFRPAGSCGPQPPAAKARNSRCSCRPSLAASECKLKIGNPAIIHCCFAAPAAQPVAIPGGGLLVSPEGSPAPPLATGREQRTPPSRSPDF